MDDHSEVAALPLDDETDGTEESLSNRERILSVATEEFSTVGFAGTAVNRLAEKSGLNKQLIYHYFGSKRGLYEAVMERWLTATVVTHYPTRPEDVFDLSKSLPDRGTWYRLLGWEGLQEPLDEIPYSDLRKEQFDWLERIVRSQQNAGVIDARAEPEMVTLLWTLALIAPSVFPQLTRIITGQLPDDDFDQRMQRLLRLLFGPIAEAN